MKWQYTFLCEMYTIIRYKLSCVHCEPLKRTPLKIAQRKDSTTEDVNGHIRRHVYVLHDVNDMKVNNAEET